MPEFQCPVCGGLLRREGIQSLFMMTPYYYQTGREDQKKLAGLETLETEIAFCLFAHERV